MGAVKIITMIVPVKKIQANVDITNHHPLAALCRMLTTAGRSLDDERSENGNLTSNTESSEAETMLRPPPAGSSLQKELPRSRGLSQR